MTKQASEQKRKYINSTDHELFIEVFIKIIKKHGLGIATYHALEFATKGAVKSVMESHMSRFGKNKLSELNTNSHKFEIRKDVESLLTSIIDSFIDDAFEVFGD